MICCTRIPVATDAEMDVGENEDSKINKSRIKRK